MTEWAASLPLSANVKKRKSPYGVTLHLECGVPALGGDAVPLAESQVRSQLREGPVAVDRRVLLVQALRSNSYLILINHHGVRIPNPLSS